MTELHPRLGRDDQLADRFVTLRVAATAEAPPWRDDPSDRPLRGEETVLARLDDELRRDAVVVARRADAYEVRRVGQVTGDTVELLPLDPATAAVEVRRDSRAVVGTVVLRWRDDGVAAWA